MTLEAAGRRWPSFNLREDQFGPADRFIGRVGPDRRESPTQARITEIVARGEFVTWRAARVGGDHDLNTFLVRADPVALQPGMSVWLDQPRGPERR